MSSGKIDIENFIPEYPDLQGPESGYEVARKKEFYDLRLERSEPTDREQGDLLDSQKFMQRFFSPRTPYRRALVFAKMGTGKCIHPDTIVPTSKGTLMAKQLWSKYSSNIRFYDEDGGLWADSTEKIYVCSYNEKTGKMVNRPIKRLYRQPVNENLVSLSLDDGSNIIITQQHHLFDGQKWTNDFEEGNFICLPEYIKLKTESKVSNIASLAYIMAWQISEGHEREDKPCVMITQKDRTVLESLKNIMTDFFQKEEIAASAIIYEGPSYHCPYLQVSSIAYRKYLESLGYIWGRKSAGKDIPDFIVYGNEDTRRTFLRSYFDGDGTVVKNVVSVCSASFNVITKLGIMLRSFGLWLRIKKKLKGATNGKNIKRLYYEGSLTVQDSIKFKKLIGFATEYKQNGINEDGVRNTNVHFIPCSELLQKIKKETELPYKDILSNLYISGRQNPSKTTIDKACDNLRRAVEEKELSKEVANSCITFIEELQKVKTRELLYTRIKKIEIIPYKGFVYDFEVEEHHNYVANGILCHNSCVISAIAEMNKNTIYDGKPRKPVLILVKNEELIRNLMNEISQVCTKDVYVPKPTASELKKGMKMTKEAQTRRLTDAIKKNYKIVTWDTFLKNLEPDEVLNRKYKGVTIMIDEAHALRIQPTRKKKTKPGSRVEPVDDVDDDVDDVDDDDVDDDDTAVLKKEGRAKEKPAETAKMIYKQLHHFLHVVEDSRILLFTGTPIWDRTSEIASLMNLILEDRKYNGRDEQLPTGAKFNKAFFNEKGELKPESVEILKERFRGKVSFLREMITSAKREEMGTKAPWFKYIKVYPCQMSDFQAAYASQAKEELVVVKGKGKGKEKIAKGGTVRKTEREAANMVLPIFKGNEVSEGGYSQVLFKKYAEEEVQVQKKTETTTVKRYKLKDKRLKKELKDNLKEYSAKLAAIVEHAKANPNEVIFIYTGEHVTGVGGAIMDGLVLQEHGFEWAKTAKDISKPNETKRRFAVITSDPQTTNEAKQIQELLASHNKADNCYGDRLQIIIGSVKVALGFTIKHVRRIYIKMPHWNIPSTEQALFRGFRFGSHEALKPEERYIKIFRLVSVEKGELAKGSGFPSNEAFSVTKTSDIEVYEIAEKKEYKNTQIYRLLKETAFDCALNYRRNVLPEDVDGSRECDYRKCNYQCDAFPAAKTDKTGKVYNYSIPAEKLDYSTYSLFYSDDRVKAMRDSVIQLFNNYFFLELDLVKQLLDASTEEDTQILLRAIDSIIESRVLIRNRYGFACYLKEQGNVLFLDSSISPKANYPEATYIENPLITEKTSMDSFVEILELESDKKSINKFCANPTVEGFDKLSHRTKIVLLEAAYAYSRRFKKSKDLPNTIKIVLDKEKGWGKYLHTLSDANVIHILYTEEFKGVAYDVAAKDIKVTGLMRIFDEEEELWKYLEDGNKEEEYVKELKDENVMDDYDFEDNSYGVIGWISTKDKKFRVKLKQDPGKKGKIRGKVCSTFKVPELVDIFVNKIKYLPSPKEEYKRLKKVDLIQKIKGKIGFEEYTENIEDKDVEYLKGLLTLLTMRINELCEELENWFNTNNLMFIK